MGGNLILDKLKGVKERFEEVGRLINEPEVISDMKRYVKLNKEYKDLEPVIRAYEEYKNLSSNIATARDMLANEKDEEMKEMVRAVIAMAHNLKLKVVAEGVETLEQMNYLLDLKCDFLQGFLFSEALPSKGATELLKSGFSIFGERGE